MMVDFKVSMQFLNLLLGMVITMNAALSLPCDSEIETQCIDPAVSAQVRLL